eukprot:comp21651_c0_seq1/m.30431 comp21651_c0_seq1/g.30431  ORF comp21651_c0_seq1/g.30431 comp21651_c0_seq1/m.30431 type:complete len:396 (-) comp21651_c0_seq1:238-1425(-)
MSSAEHQRLVAEFVEMTHATEAQAKFTLEAHNWQLEAAVSSFYEDGAMEEDDPDYETEEPEDEEMSPAPPPPQTRAQAAPQQSQPPPPKKPASRFATLNDYRSDGEEDEDKTKAKQQYFAGGSERSGQMIEGPAKKDKADDFVSSIFEKARSSGREVKQEESDSNRWKAFGGQGSKLGEDEGPSETVGTSLQGAQRPTPTVHDLVFWSTGFTVNDGELRRYDDPANREFLEDVDKGLAPRELSRVLTPSQNKAGLEIRVHDRKHEDYVPPKKTVKAFVGSGQRLGSPVPSVKSSMQTAATPMAPAERESSGPAVTVDEAKPTTSIQIRLADGTRMVAKLNHNHTVGDIRRFVSTSRPGMGPFVLMTTFPNKELTDDALTLSDAKLLNAVIVQKMK